MTRQMSRASNSAIPLVNMSDSLPMGLSFDFQDFDFDLGEERSKASPLLDGAGEELDVGGVRDRLAEGTSD